MTKYILSPNPNPPFNLVRHSLPYGSLTAHYDTEAQMVNQVVHRLRAVNVLPSEYWVVDEAQLPGGVVGDDTDRTQFFDAWYWDEGVRVDMDKARAIHMNDIRRARDAALAALDPAHFKAIESGNDKTIKDVVRRKQTLRDIPQTLSLVTPNNSPDELAGIWPEGLPR